MDTKEMATAVVQRNFNLKCMIELKGSEIVEGEDGQLRLDIGIFLQTPTEKVELAVMPIELSADNVETLKKDRKALHSISDSVLATARYDLCDIIVEKLLGKNLPTIEKEMEALRGISYEERDTSVPEPTSDDS